MKKNDLTSVFTHQFSKQKKLFALSFILILTSFILKAQTITGNNPYCIANNPTYTIINPPATGTYDRIEWLSNDPAITFSGNPAPLTLTKVVQKSGNIINSPSSIYAKFYSGTTVIGETQAFNFITPPAPSLPDYTVTKTNDYCTNQYHIITLRVDPIPNPSPNTSFNIVPRIANASIVVTQTSTNVFELKLPLNGESYFLYDVIRTAFLSGCPSNSVTTTSYGNSVSLNLTGCTNNTPNVNYDFTIAPNPYNNGYITIYAPAITASTGTTCRVYNSSGVLKATFTLAAASTAFPLKATIGPALTVGLYIVQITYSNGLVRTQNLVVN